jgi:hypothetical protein
MNEGMSEPDPVDELLAAAEVLSELDAARAEAWASGLLAEWTDHDELLAVLRGRPEPAALAIATALTPMLPAAAEVVDALRADGAPLPPFAPHIGTARADAAWTIHDLHGTGTSIVVEYEHDDEVRHDMLVELDGDIAVDLLVGPSGVVEAAREEATRRFAIDEISPDDATARIRAALERVHAGADVPLTDAFFLNHALVASRVGLPVDLPDVAPGAVDDDDRPRRAPDPEGDALARSTLAAALGRLVPEPPSAQEIAAAADAWRATQARDDADAVAVGAEIGPAVDGPDVDVLLRLAGAYVAPGPRAGLSPAAADAVDALEWADWLGAVLPLVRAGAGADASPEQLVRNINRCPEVTTSIPKRDAPAVASAFAVALPAWRLAGAIDDEQRLTPLGVWLLPHALAQAWGAPSGTL